MKNRWMAGAVAAAVALLIAVSAGGQTGFKAPRAPDGKANLNGIWQAMNTAHWDIEAHSAAAGPIDALGAAYAVPGGPGVVEGGIPYKPEALARKKENFTNRLKIPRSSAICRACRARPTCPIPSRSSRARST
jgi:hypothetical protein